MFYLAPSSFPISPILAEGLAFTTFGRSSAAKMKKADKARFGPAAFAFAALYFAISACCLTLRAAAFFSYPALAPAGHLAHLKFKANTSFYKINLSS